MAAGRPTPAIRSPALGGLSLLLGSALLLGCGTPRPGDTLPPGVPRGVRVIDQEVHYDVEGLNPRDIAASMSRASQKALGGRFRGYHQWNLIWQYSSGPTLTAGCAITSATVILEAETTLPRWVDRDRADSTLIALWDDYIAALRTHENGHRDHAYRAAAGIQRALIAIRASSCALITGQASRAARDIANDHRRLQAEYDRDTRHGATQGAHWPPQPVDGTGEGDDGAA